MEWYALRVSEDERVEKDLTSAGIRVFRPTYQVEFFSQRKSVVIARTHPLMAGYLLVGQSAIPLGVTHCWHEYLPDHATSHPLRVPEADELISRCVAGEFDVRREEPGHFDVHARVMVLVLGLYGVIVGKPRRSVYDVLLDIGRSVQVRQPGLEAA